MAFNSLAFSIYLPAVFIIYWFVLSKNLKLQNLFLVIVSYFFYGWWNWKYLSLLLISSLTDYFIGLELEKYKNPTKRKIFLLGSIMVNLGILGIFKYYNFFLDSFITLFSYFGINIRSTSLQLILPVGISFYTFQTMSYTIDVYKKRIEPTKDLIAFLAYVSFFPQLVAGPIERATNLLPQFFKERKFDYSKATEGMRQILWGLIKKVVIADNCAEHANIIFFNADGYSGSTLLLGVLFFAFQIYGDFSGYSDVAIGTSRLFGFSLMKNFAYPYFSRDIAEFWRRWHISLSSWFKDYVYIPLGGSRQGVWSKVRNTFIIFLLSGLWHGANWTFIVWGFLNAIYFLPLLLTNNNRKNIEIVAKGRSLPTVKEFLSILCTFIITLFAWIFFRSENIGDAISYISKIFSPSLFTIPVFIGRLHALRTLFFIVIFILIEWQGREKDFALQDIETKCKSPIVRYLLYYLLIFSLFWFGGEEQKFIYFQF
ncbi:MAG: hypothetical protein N2053_03775 [Chitinispirillaceae bacterium]|nr:hypothetical protein [Chitinispirillaceae bacterium]